MEVDRGIERTPVGNQKLNIITLSDSQWRTGELAVRRDHRPSHSCDSPI